MRILFLSNFYPPVFSGGYTQWCQEVAECLQARGHNIRILTSDYGREQTNGSDSNVHRRLNLDGNLYNYQPSHFFGKWRKEHRRNLVTLKREVEDFAPDLIFVWGMWAMSKALAARAEQILPSRVVYYISDYWPISDDIHTKYWSSPTRRWCLRLPKRFISPFALWALTKEVYVHLNQQKFEHVICVSEAVKEILLRSGLPISHAHVIHGGTDVTRFPQVEKDFSKLPLKLLYAGQLVAHKGVHTAIEALAALAKHHIAKEIHLTIVGSGHPDYEDYLYSLVERESLQDYVTFLAAVSKKEMPKVFQRSDILIFPSTYEEPFARITQEAMLSGLVVVGTTTGGTKEILYEDQTGLTFKKGDSEGLAAQISRLLVNPQLCRRLSSNGRQKVLDSFTLDKMVDRIEMFLQKILVRNLQNDSIVVERQ